MNGLGIISIEYDIGESINIDMPRQDFAKMKARQVPFRKI